ncbi:hypothetical protein ABK686_08885 [Klebsiella pneumoniae]|uniref:hypothetical protein n=1 Tax=Enterobacteriaceae TaxID=543 RepID=UPI001376DE14|nr:hypothetical protein [Enterobacter cloacae]NBF84327.1 hypothetical protein [Enterobacter cloacae]HBB4749931.1 hypothetical protein [Enterobacter cloacae]HDH0230734.1 hypothetical protein [Klebsiella pneumoniae]
MRTVQEILDSMSPELRRNAAKAVEESRIFAPVLAQIPSPSALNGLYEQTKGCASYDEAFA